MSKATTISSLWKRCIHYKVAKKQYPEVKVEDVVLNPPRAGFRKVRPPLLSQLVTDTLFPSIEIRNKYVEAGKPIPRKFGSQSDEIARRNYLRFQEEVAAGEPSFKVGGNQIYFPSGRICLLRPNAKHTPYQAKFLVPKSMNKMDLRDYLWHIYGLRTVNITVQLLHAPFKRGLTDYARHRGPQLKKMTVDMLEPFVWPEVPKDLEEQAKKDSDNERQVIEHKNSSGSDKLKPIEAYDGLYKRPSLPDAFVSSKSRREGAERVASLEKSSRLIEDKKRAAQVLGL